MAADAKWFQKGDQYKIHVFFLVRGNNYFVYKILKKIEIFWGDHGIPSYPLYPSLILIHLPHTQTFRQRIYVRDMSNNGTSALLSHQSFKVSHFHPS